MYEGCRGLMDFVRSPSRSFHGSSGSGRSVRGRAEIASEPLATRGVRGVVTGDATDDTR